MKKISFLITLLLICAFCSSCNYSYIESSESKTTSDQSATEQHPAENRSGFAQIDEQDVLDAKSVVLEELNTWVGCSQIEFYYDDIRAKEEIKRHKRQMIMDGANAISLVNKSFIVLFTVFKTDSSVEPGKNSTLNPNTTYDFSWLLSREENSKEWVIISYGM